jgi:large subunit ribosomal protein L29
MKARELRDLTAEELLKKKKDFKEEIFNLRFQHSTGQLENTSRMKLLRRDVARIEMALREKELQVGKTSERLSAQAER